MATYMIIQVAMTCNHATIIGAVKSSSKAIVVTADEITSTVAVLVTVSFIDTTLANTAAVSSSTTLENVVQLNEKHRSFLDVFRLNKSVFQCVLVFQNCSPVFSSVSEVFSCVLETFFLFFFDVFDLSYVFSGVFWSFLGVSTSFLGVFSGATKVLFGVFWSFPGVLRSLYQVPSSLSQVFSVVFQCFLVFSVVVGVFRLLMFLKKGKIRLPKIYLSAQKPEKRNTEEKGFSS